MSTAPDLPLIKPSDARSWSLCERRVWLDNKDDLNLQPIDDPFQQLMIQQGLLHEKAVLAYLSSDNVAQTATSPEDTTRLMAAGVPIIYQPQLLNANEGILGFPDFLILNSNGEYQAADAKLSFSEYKKEIQVQLGIYRALLDSALPAKVYLGNDTEALIGDEANSVANEFLSDMRRLLSLEEEPTAKYSHSKCRACPYYTHCKPAFEEKEELSLLYRIERRAAIGLEEAGIDTISKLADTDPNAIPDIPYLKGIKKKKKAVLQAKSYLSGEVFKDRS